MKIQTLVLFTFCFFSFVFTNCDSTDLPLNNQTCGSEIIIDTNYDSTTGDAFTITNITITENCLTATVQYGGGCGDELVSFEFLASTASFPVTIPAMLDTKIIMDDNDDCEALITKDISFDLTALEEEGFNNINIGVEGWNEILQYSF